MRPAGGRCLRFPCRWTAPGLPRQIVASGADPDVPALPTRPRPTALPIPRPEVRSDINRGEERTGALLPMRESTLVVPSTGHSRRNPTRGCRISSHERGGRTARCTDTVEGLYGWRGWGTAAHELAY